MGFHFEENGDPEAEGGIGKPRFAWAAMACGLDFCGEDGGGGGELGAKEVLGGGAGWQDRDAVAEGGIGREKEVDVGGLERIGGRAKFRERNCRRS